MGHVGLPTALSLAAKGWTVLGSDSSQPLIAQLQAGKAPYYEPGLDELVKSSESKTCPGARSHASTAASSLL